MDFYQLKAIVKYSLIQELRTSRAAGRKHAIGRTLISFLCFYTMAGMVMVFLLFAVKDPFTGSMAITTLSMLLVGSLVLLEFPTLATGPEDFSFYSFRPVSSKTYFFSKAAVILIYVLSLTMILFLPSLVLMAVSGKPVYLIAGNFYSILIGNLFMALLIVSIYGLLVKFIPYRAIRSFASFFQMILFFSVYAGFAVVSQVLKKQMGDFIMSSHPFLLLLPSAWGASIFRLNQGWLYIACFLLSLFSILFLIRLARGMISMGYAQRIAELAQIGDKIKKRKAGQRKRTSVLRTSVLWKSPESKAVSFLIGKQFRFNSQFRMGIITIIPLTIVYLLIVLFSYNAPILDPFTQAGREIFGKTFLLYLAIGFFPFYLKHALVFSSESEASWIFFSTPASKLKLIFAARQFILIFFIFPYIFLLFLLYVILAKEFVHVLMHFFVISLLVLIQTDILLLFFAEVPFSKKLIRGQRSVQMYLKMLIGIIVILPIFLFVHFIYPQPALYFPSVVLLFAILFFIKKAGKNVAVKKLKKEEFLQI